MTGAYVRVKREGKMCNIEIEHLTDEERAEMFRGHEKDLLKWLNFLSHFIAVADVKNGE